MPSQRRVKILMIAVVAILVLSFYYSGEPNRIQNQKFYRSTIEAMKAKEDAKHAKTKEKIQDAMAHPGVNGGGSPADKADIQRPAVPVAKENENEEKKNEEKKNEEKKNEEKKNEEKKNEEKKKVEMEDIPIAGRTKMTVPKNKDQDNQGIQDSPSNSGSEAPKEEAVDHQDVKSELNAILKKSPIIVFSKSYCPYSMKAKSILLEGYTISPKPYVVELDLHPIGADLQQLLEQKTGRRTVPNVLVNGKSIGGGDDIAALDESDELASKLRSLGGKWIVDVSRGPTREHRL